MAVEKKLRQVSVYFESIELTGTAELTMDVDFNFPHWFVGVTFFSDAELTTPVTPASGTLDVTVLTAMSDVVQGIDNGTIAAATPTLASFDGNPDQIIVTETVGVVGANFMLVKAVGNMA